MVSSIKLLQNPDCMPHIENDGFLDIIPRKYKLAKTISCNKYCFSN